MKWLLGLAVSFTANAAVLEDPALACADLLKPPFRLGIGVFAETFDGNLRVGISPYAGSLHAGIVDRFIEKEPIRRVLLMGEIRFRVFEGQVEFLEANETSGHFLTLSRTGLHQDGRLVPVSNSIEAIPLASRAPGYRGVVYDKADEHLARELNGLEVDIRHTIGNSLQMFSSITRQIHVNEKLTDAEKAELFEEFRTDRANHLMLIEWLASNLVQDGRLSLVEMYPLLAALKVFHDPAGTVNDIRQISYVEIYGVITRLSNMINPNSGLVPIDFYTLP